MTACTIEPGTICEPGHLVCVLAEAGLLDLAPATETCPATWTSERNGRDRCRLEPGHERWTHVGRFTEWVPTSIVEQGVQKRAQCPDCGSRRLVRYAPSTGIIGPGDECRSCGWFQCDET